MRHKYDIGCPFVLSSVDMNLEAKRQFECEPSDASNCDKGVRLNFNTEYSTALTLKTWCFYQTQTKRNDHFLPGIVSVPGNAQLNHLPIRDSGKDPFYAK